ncbi:MAG: CPBP family intramembrane glutamic endopeptidase [Planctomycetota bacterium]
MQPLSWHDFWPAAATSLFVPRLVIGAVAIFVLGALFGGFVGGPRPAATPGRAVAVKIVSGCWMAVATLSLAWWLGIPLEETALVPRAPLLSLAFAVGIGAAVAPVIVTGARLQEMRRFYPEMRLTGSDCAGSSRTRWRLAMLAAWLIYLIGYEALFRGLLLPILTRELDLWPGMAVATGLYVLAHHDRPAVESLAAIPTGFVMAAITLTTGSFLAPLLLHWIIAAVNETASASLAVAGSRR